MQLYVYLSWRVFLSFYLILNLLFSQKYFLHFWSSSRRKIFLNQVDRKAGVEAGQPLNASSNQNWLKTYFSQSQFKTLNIFNLLLCDSMQNKLDVQTNKKLLPFTDNIYPFCYFLSRLLPIILMNSTLQLKKVLNCLLIIT